MMNHTGDKFTKVFVGTIPHTVTEEEIRAEMTKIGTIVTFFYMPDKAHENRGWALITYSSAEEAKAAILNLDGKFKFPGSERAIEVRYAEKKPEKMEISPYAPPISTAMPRHQNPWIEYFSADKHPYYYNTITGLTQWERPPEMDMPPTTAALPTMAGLAALGASGMATPTGNSSYGPRGSNLFIFHIPSDWNDVDLVQHFQHYGSIRSARIQRDTSGRNRGFGFVSFDNVQSARAAINGMNGFNVGGKFLKVKVKKGEEDANDEGLDVSQMGAAMFNTSGMAGMGSHFHYSNQVASTHHIQPHMYTAQLAQLRPHVPHYSPY